MKFGLENVTAPNMGSLFSSVVLGIVGGLLGACFVIGNIKVNMFRRAYLISKKVRVFEAIFFAFVTSSAFFWLPSSTRNYC